MNIQRVFDHSVDLNRISAGGWVLDIGCRNYGFSTTLANLGCNVVAVDADPQVTPCENPAIRCVNAAVVHKPNYGKVKLCLSLGNDNYVVTPGHPNETGREVEVATTTIDELAAQFGVEHWAIIKMDCEGSEYDILQSIQRPVADQVSVEFHEHTRSAGGAAVINTIVKHLEQWYNVHNLKMTHEQGVPALNYWDVLWTLK